MSEAFSRGLILYAQGRHDLAEREFRRALAEEPDHAEAHAFLADCLCDADREADALHEADEAVRLDPEAAHGYAARARSLFGLGRLREAEEAASEALRIEPYSAHRHFLFGYIVLNRGRKEEALAAAESGLALDAEDGPCLNLRSMALTQLGRKEEASATLGSALEKNPDDAFTHANIGWAFLHKAEPDRALGHFREALRLEPDMEWAREGIVEALKARHWVYRQMLAFFLWLGRQSTYAQWVVIFGLFFGRRLLAQLAESYPALTPFILPIEVALIGFVILTWVADPLFDLLLMFNRFGRLALSRRERVKAIVVGGAFLIAVGCLAPALAGGNAAFTAMLYFGLLIFPLTLVFQRALGSLRLPITLGAVAVALLGLPAVIDSAYPGVLQPLLTEDRIKAGFGLFAVGAMLSTWVPALLLARNLNR